MNDDFYITRPVSEVPAMHRGPIDRVIHHYDRKYAGRPVGRYRQGMADTRHLLESWGHTDLLSYEVHVPMPLEKQKVVDVLKRAFAERTISALHKRTLYGNHYQLGGIEVEDTKVLSNGFYHPNRVPYVSTTDSTFKLGSVGVYLRRHFPDPSPYETE